MLYPIYVLFSFCLCLWFVEIEFSSKIILFVEVDMCYVHDYCIELNYWRWETTMFISSPTLKNII
jgi:hypothetical protein